MSAVSWRCGWAVGPRLVSLLIAGTWLAACARVPTRVGPCETPPPFHLTIEASPRLNPDSAGRPLSTVVQVLQLKDLGRMKNLEFAADVVERLPALLADDLVKPPEEVTVQPGEVLSRWYARDPNARHVVVMGAFFKPPGRDLWWSSYSLAPVPDPRCVPQPPLEQGRSPSREDERPRFRLENNEVQTISGVTRPGGAGRDA